MAFALKWLKTAPRGLCQGLLSALAFACFPVDNGQKTEGSLLDSYSDHRDSAGRFKAGNPGGPGRPAGPTLRPLLRDMLAETDANGQTLERRLLGELLRLATDQGERTQHRLRAIELVMQAAEWRSISTPADEAVLHPIQIFDFIGRQEE